MTVQVWRAILFGLGIVIVIGTILGASRTYNYCLSSYQSDLEKQGHDYAHSSLLYCISPVPLDIFESGRAKFMVHQLTGGSSTFPLLIGWMLILIAFVGIVATASRIIQQRRCPDDGELRRYLYGRMKKDSPQARRITAHLGICEECQERVRDFNAQV